MKTPAYLQQFINKAALPLWKSNLWLRSLSSRLVPNRAEAISQGTGVRIIKATTPLGINYHPCWHTEKRDRGLSGPERLASPLPSQCSPSASGLPGQGESADPTTRAVCSGWTSLHRGLGREHQEKVTGRGWWNNSVHSGERGKLFMRLGKFINFPHPFGIYSNCLLTSLSSLASFHVTLLSQKGKKTSPCIFFSLLASLEQ